MMSTPNMNHSMFNFNGNFGDTEFEAELCFDESNGNIQIQTVTQQQNPQIASQCLVEEQQRQRAAQYQLISEQSQLNQHMGVHVTPQQKHCQSAQYQQMQQQQQIPKQLQSQQHQQRLQIQSAQQMFSQQQQQQQQRYDVKDQFVAQVDQQQLLLQTAHQYDYQHYNQQTATQNRYQQQQQVATYQDYQNQQVAHQNQSGNYQQRAQVADHFVSQQRQNIQVTTPPPVSQVPITDNAYIIAPRQCQEQKQQQQQSILPVTQEVPQPVGSPEIQLLPKHMPQTVEKPDIQPYVEIIEQPAPRSSRFRYTGEVRTNGGLHGVNSTLECKTYPTIRLVGYDGEAIAVVSCVTKDAPYKPHPHSIVGQSCRNGICEVKFDKDMLVKLDKIGIMCIKKKDYEDSLRVREEIKVDPFNTGFDHKEFPDSIEPNSIRLAFQVLLKGPTEQYTIVLPAIVSDPIHNKKSSPEPVIYKVSHSSGPATGNQEMIILSDRITYGDIKIRFFEVQDTKVVWESYVDLSKVKSAIHKQVAIVFQSPKYRTFEFDEKVTVFIELVRPSNGLCSNAVPFDFTSVFDFRAQRKRKRLDDSITKRLEGSSTYFNPTNQLDQP